MPKRKEFEVFPTEDRKAKCKGCDAPILWHRKSSTDRWMPLDVNSGRQGFGGSVFMESHHAHCPNADSFRRKR